MWKLLFIVILIFLGCSKESPSSKDQPPAVIQVEVDKDSDRDSKKDKDDDVDSVKEGFQETGKGFKKAGSEMEKGFKKAGTEIKEFFVGEDKND